MDKIKINREGRKTLTNLLLSCVLMPTKLSGKQEAVAKLSSFGLELMDLSDLQTDTTKPNYLPVIASLQKFALKEGIDVIDSNFLWKFFGGLSHYESVLKDVEALPGKTKCLWTVAHMLLPVIVKKRKGEFLDVAYINGSVDLLLENVYISDHMSVEDNDQILIHYATVVDVDCPKSVCQELLVRQSQFTDFMKAARSLSKVNFRKFFTGDLTQRTKDIFVKSN